MNKMTLSNQSTSEILTSLADSTLEGIITGLKNGSLDLPGVSESTRQACLHATQIEAARRKARRLVEELGTEHPMAFMAILEFVELSDPGATEKALEESGITLPAPTHVDEDGKPFYSSEDIADALDAPHDQVQKDIERMCELAPDLAPVGVKLHRIQ